MASVVRKLSRAAVVAVSLAVAACMAPPARAVIVGTNPPATAPDAATLSQPAGITGWNNLGKLSIGGGVYLGNGWFITATHLDPGTNNLIFMTRQSDNATVAIGLDKNSVTRLSNSAGNADMDLVHVDPSSASALAALNLQQLNISTATPIAGTPITLAGVGSIRGNPVTYNSDFSGPGSSFKGYQFDPGDNAAVERRWGTNVTRNINGNSPTDVVSNPVNGSNTVVFGADFTDPASGLATAFEAQGVNHDSGGAVFSANNTLLGILLYQATFNGQPAGTAIYGDFSEASDLSQYYSQILSVTGVPEPASAALLGAAATGLLLRRRGRRRA